MAERLFNLPETKGFFKLRGVVEGCQKNDFYTEDTTLKGKDRRTVSFSVNTSKDNKIPCKLTAYKNDEVSFHKKAEKKGEKGTTKKVPWDNRFESQGEGYDLIGMDVGLVKVESKSRRGKMVNLNKRLTEFDAAKYVSEHLEDGQSVFVKGNMEYGSFVGKNDNKIVFSRIKPTQISLCSEEINLDDDGREIVSEFVQTIVVTSIEKEVIDDKPTGRTLVLAKIVGYFTIEDAEFYVEDNKFATVLSRNVKPYNSITVSGDIVLKVKKEETEEDDYWGSRNSMTKIKSPARKELIITGADPFSLDKTTYTREAIEEALEKIKKSQEAKRDFGESEEDDNGGFSESEWGNVKGFESMSDDEGW